MSDEAATIDLASLADFQIGGLHVSPSSCKVRMGTDETRVEPRVMEVLIVLWQALGRTVSRDQLIERCWGGRAVSDDAVNRVISKVRPLGRATPLPHFTIETVPKIGFRMEVGEAARDTSASAAPVTAGWAALSHLQQAQRIIVPVLVLLVAFSAFWMWRREPSQPAALPHVVIAPLTTLQELEDVRQLAAVSTHELTRTLTAEGMRATVESAGAQREDGGLRLTGTANFDGAQYQLLLTVTDQADGQVLWSGSFARKAAERKGLEHEAANETAATLRCGFRYAGEAARPLPNETVSTFVQACHALDKETLHAELAMDVTRRLVVLAPNFANAHALRSLALSNRASQVDHLSGEAEDWRREARDESRKALALDAQSSIAHSALARLALDEGRFAEAERHYKSAIALDEGDRLARSGYLWLLRMMGRSGAALEFVDGVDNRAGALIQAAFMLSLSGNMHEAEQKLKILEHIRPRLVAGVRFAINAFWEKPETALNRLPQFATEIGANRFSCWDAYLKALIASAGNPRHGLAATCENLNVDWRIRMLARQGDVDGAFALLAPPMPNSRRSLAFLFYPEMTAVRRDARFMPLAQRLGLLSYWRETGNWPDFCSEPDLPYVCKEWRAG